MIPEIIRAYCEPHRKYHNLSHLNFMIDKAIEWKWKLTDELLFAITFHDAVYAPGAKDNEERSAEMYADDAGIDGVVARTSAVNSQHAPQACPQCGITLIPTHRAILRAAMALRSLAAVTRALRLYRV